MRCSGGRSQPRLPALRGSATPRSWNATGLRFGASQCRCYRAGARPLRVLHLTDLHLMPGQRRKVEWVRELADAGA